MTDGRTMPPAPSADSPLEEGDPAADLRAFRRCLGQFTTGVTVMTTSVDGRPVGVTANSFSSLSLDPPLVMWSIARTSRSFDAFAGAGHYAVNVLGVDQVALSQLFASPVDDRFTGLDWHPSSTGAPVLPGVIALFECETQAVQDGGDHIILIGRVRRFARYAGNPLIYAQGRYAVAEDHPSVIVRTDAPADQGRAGTSLTDLRFTSLLSYLVSFASEGFDAYRQSEGVSLLHSRTLFAIGRDSVSFDEILRRCELSRISADDVLSSLTEMGVVQGEAGQFRLTAAGLDLLAKLTGQLDRFETDLLSGIPPADVQVTRRVLESLCRKLGCGI